MWLYASEQWFNMKFFVIDVQEYKAPPILGLQSCEEMDLITVRSNNNIISKQSAADVDTLKTMFPKQCDKIGNFEGEVTLILKEDAEPFIAAPRKCSVHMRDRIRKELEYMEEKGIIRKVDEHSDWCSNVCFVTKRDGSLRVCLDPKRLNENLK